MTAPRELMALAAKAAGIKYTYDTDAGCVILDDTGNFVRYWNPKGNGSDSQWLAAHLRLIVRPGKHKGDGCTVEAQQEGIPSCTAFYDDPAQQMREAILMVAAAIGKSLP